MRSLKGLCLWGSFGVSLAMAAFLSTPAQAQTTWTFLDNQPGVNLDTCLLLTDGTVMCLGSGTNSWHRLRPDPQGFYTHGKWDQPNFTVADMPPGVDPHLESIDPTTMVHTVCNPCTYAPRFFSSALLRDGRVVVVGGEYNTGQTVVGSSPADGHVFTDIGFIYDPRNDNGGVAGAGSWSQQLSEPLGGGNMGDVFGLVLPDGTYLVAPAFSVSDLESLNPTTKALTLLGSQFKADGNFEEGMVLLPNGTLLDVDSKITGVNQSEIYFPLGSTLGPPNTWGGHASIPVNLTGNGDDDVGGGGEIGPALLRPDGKLIWFTGNSLGKNALYNTADGTWAEESSADFPVDPTTMLNYGVKDGPAAIMPNGNVLVMAAPTDNSTFHAGSHFFEVRFSDDTMVQLDTTNEPNILPTVPTFVGRLLILPTGEALFNTMDLQGVWIYSNNGSPQDAWRPVIASAPVHVAPGTTYPISGTQFNGFSSGSMYGDDSQNATNYPLVRIKNIGTNNVFYARTHDHSSLGVDTVGSTQLVTTQFDTPTSIDLGPSTLEVVVNGIPSALFDVNVAANTPPVAQCRNFTTSASASCLGAVSPANIDNGSFDPDGDAINCTLNPTGPFGLGNSVVTLTCTDPSGASSSCSATVSVVDTTPPVLTLPPNEAVAICTNGSAVQVGQATATDNCASGLVPTGQVISKNGIALVPPIPVVAGQVTLGIGTFVIRWTVSDGTNSVTSTETVVVGTTIQASQSFLVDDRGQVRNNGGGFAAILNSGSGTTQVGNDGRSADILSVGPVSVLHRAIVSGNVTSASTVSKATDGTITGTITMGGSVVLPPLPSLPAFPAPTLGTFTVNSATTQTRPPGSYTSGTVNGGTLILAAGDYFFQSLTINSGSTVRVAPTTRVFVRNSLIFNAPFRALAGTAVQPIFLGFAGTNLSLNAELDGTLVAPGADVLFGTGAGLTFTGSFFGRVLEITPASALVCRVQ